MDDAVVCTFVDGNRLEGITRYKEKIGILKRMTVIPGNSVVTQPTSIVAAFLAG